MTSFLRAGAAAAVAASVLTITFAPGVSSAGANGLVIAARRVLQCDIYGAAHAPCVAAYSTVRALLAYSAYLGHGQLAHSTPAVLPATKAARRAYLNDAIQTLTAR